MKAGAAALLCLLVAGCRPDPLGDYSQVGHSPWCFAETGKQLRCDYFSEKHCERLMAGVDSNYLHVCVPNPTDR